MKFKERYTSISEQTLPENKDKIVLSDDAYAISEMLSDLTVKLEQLRRWRSQA